MCVCVCVCVCVCLYVCMICKLTSNATQSRLSDQCSDTGRTRVDVNFSNRNGGDTYPVLDITMGVGVAQILVAEFCFKASEEEVGTV